MGCFFLNIRLFFFHYSLKKKKVDEVITAMDCINFEDGGTVFAVGCSNGKIFLRFYLIYNKNIYYFNIFHNFFFIE